MILKLKYFFILFFLVYSGTVFAQPPNKTDENGKKQGYWEVEHSNGTTRYKGQFEHGVPTGKFKYYNEKGTIVTILVFTSNDSATATHFHTNSKKAATGVYVNQLKEGFWRFYDKKGILASEQQYDKGVKNGPSKVFNLDGSISRESFYVNDIENGYRKTYDNQGNVLTEGQIKDGQMDGVQIWYRSGVINIKGAYKHAVQDGDWIFYDEKGNPYKTEHYELGIKK